MSVDGIETNSCESGLCKPTKEDTIKDDLKEQIVDAIGGFGKWQLRKCIFIIFIIFYFSLFQKLKIFHFSNIDQF